MRCFLVGWCSSNLWIRTKWLSMNCRLSQSQRSPGGLGQKSPGQQQAARVKKIVRSLSNQNLTSISFVSQWHKLKPFPVNDLQNCEVQRFPDFLTLAEHTSPRQANCPRPSGLPIMPHLVVSIVLKLARTNYRSKGLLKDVHTFLILHLGRSLVMTIPTY